MTIIFNGTDLIGHYKRLIKKVILNHVIKTFSVSINESFIIFIDADYRTGVTSRHDSLK